MKPLSDELWDQYCSSSDYDKRIPPPSIDYNSGYCEDIAEYLRRHRFDSCAKELPLLMNRGGLKKNGHLLDYGCGLGRLAYAAAHYLDSQGMYTGIDINSEAIRFLRDAYQDKNQFSFTLNEVPESLNYVAIQSKQNTSHLLETSSSTNHSSNEKLFDLREKFDVQWSASVFTHMWLDAIEYTLNQFSKCAKPGSYCFNTWLIVDDFADYMLRCGVADRKLPFVINGARTYSKANPLVCTAYSLSDVLDVYKKAGHVVEDVLYGTWAGRDNGVIYQDIVDSKPRN